MRTTVSISILLCAASVVVSSSARAQDAVRVQPAEEAPDPIDRWDIAAWDHFELSMGFIAGVRRYDHAAFGLEGDAAFDGAADLREPFQDGTFDRLTTMGLRYDARLVAAYTRMTVGVDIPFAHYRPTEATGTYDVGGTRRTVTVRHISPVLVHFGIGAELPIGPIAPFVDVLGHLRWTTATLAIDGVEQKYTEHGFGFSARAGLRLHVRRWFYAALAGEVGLVGDTRWGGELSVGYAAY